MKARQWLLLAITLAAGVLLFWSLLDIRTNRLRNEDIRTKIINSLPEEIRNTVSVQAKCVSMPEVPREACVITFRGIQDPGQVRQELIWRLENL